MLVICLLCICVFIVGVIGISVGVDYIPNVDGSDNCMFDVCVCYVLVLVLLLVLVL